MKRIPFVLTVLLLAAMLLFCAACAEDEAYVFSFREGIEWGMTPTEVYAAEGKPGRPYVPIHYDAFEGAACTIAGVEVRPLYIFMDSRLTAISVMVPDTGAQAFASVKAELADAYGEPNFDDFAAVCRATAAYITEPIEEAELAPFTKCTWKLADDRTVILLADFGGQGGLGFLFLDSDVSAEEDL